MGQRQAQATRPDPHSSEATPPLLGRSVDAVVIVRDGLVPARGTGHARIASRREPLADHGCSLVVVELGGDDDRRLGDTLGEALAALQREGVPPALTLVVADGFAARGTAVEPAGGAAALPELAGLTAVCVGTDPGTAPAGVRHLGGGLDTVVRLLDEQVRRRRTGRVPGVDVDPAWTVVVEAVDEVERRIADALFTLSDGTLATRGSCAGALDEGARLVLAAGVYTGHGPTERLLPGPWWPAARVADDAVAERRVLDLRGGVLLHERRLAGAGSAPDGTREIRFASAAVPRLLAMRAEGPDGTLSLRPPSVPAAPVAPHAGGRPPERDPDDPWRRAADAAGHEIAVLTRDRTASDTGVRTLERLATYATGPDDTGPGSGLGARLDRATERGFDRLLRDHRRTWARRWDAVDVEIPGDPDLQLAARFALFHLWGLATREDEAAIGARGLTGTGYSGHVFWDADVFVLPALMTLSPAAARAGLTYRLRRLPEAREAARAAGLEGARFPWESGRDGQDVTPRWTRRGQEVVPVRTGQLEEHIVADVAWAADRYASWTGDDTWLDTAGYRLIVETARYWAARCRRDADRTVHIAAVIGPDEYHVDVDDNAFTNVMARWNLRRGAQLLDRRRPGSAEAAGWRELAERIVDGYDPETGLYEQHRGYYGLEPLTVEALGRVPVAADLVLPADVLAASQIIKQADVLMLHHLVPDEVAPGSLRPNLDFYHPRTAHGSSLSPAVAASLLVRAGRHDEAVRMLRIALRIDLDDLTGATPAGLHVAAQGGAWQALVHGVGGLHVRDGALRVAPSVPPDWGRFRLRLRCLGRSVDLEVEGGRARIRSDGALPLWDGPRRRIVGRSVDLVRGEHGWTTGGREA